MFHKLNPLSANLTESSNTLNSHKIYKSELFDTSTIIVYKAKN